MAVTLVGAATGGGVAGIFGGSDAYPLPGGPSGGWLVGASGSGGAAGAGVFALGPVGGVGEPPAWLDVVALAGIAALLGISAF